jgi:putative PIN family toxin of toxin-antitoxin system
VNESARADLEGIRVVIDTVGFVRAMMGPTSAWGELVFRRSHQFETVLSNQMLIEIERVLLYPKVVRKLKSPSAASRSALDAAIAGATIAEVTNVPAICRDPGDDIVLATALAGEAAFILSEDNDLLDMIEYQGIQIVNGMQLLEILRG